VTSGTALCLMVFANTVSVGAFGPLLPEIARAESLADWQIGLLAGSFGFARMIADVPTGLAAGRRLGVTLAAAPLVLVAGVLLLWSAGPFPVLVLGRLLTGIGHTFGMVAGLTAILADHRDAAGAMRLNVFEFAGMTGVLVGLASVGFLPAEWGWPRALLITCSPLAITLALVPWFLREYPTQVAMPGAATRAATTASGGRVPPIVRLMFAVGVIMALAWSAISQFLIPIRGAREFGLDRAGVAQLLVLAQVVDLAALLPVGWLADRVGRLLMLSVVSGCLGVGAWAVGLGSLPFFVGGTVLLGIGMAGWMFPLGVIRQHTDAARVAWRTGLYRVGIDAAAFVGPLVCGLIGEAHTGFFVSAVGVLALVASVGLGRQALR
jgi:MFS family permease